MINWKELESATRSLNEKAIVKRLWKYRSIKNVFLMFALALNALVIFVAVFFKWNDSKFLIAVGLFMIINICMPILFNSFFRNNFLDFDELFAETTKAKEKLKTLGSKPSSYLVTKMPDRMILISPVFGSIKKVILLIKYSEIYSIENHNESGLTWELLTNHKSNSLPFTIRIIKNFKKKTILLTSMWVAFIITTIVLISVQKSFDLIILSILLGVITTLITLTLVVIVLNRIFIDKNELNQVIHEARSKLEKKCSPEMLEYLNYDNRRFIKFKSNKKFISLISYSLSQ